MAVKDLKKKALTGVVQLQSVMALLLFVPACSVRFWEAWVYWMLFLVSTLVITLYFVKRDPGLIESRLTAGPGAEHEKSQKVIQALSGVLACAVIVVPGIERRFHLSVIPVPVNWADKDVIWMDWEGTTVRSADGSVDERDNPFLVLHLLEMFGKRGGLNRSTQH